MITWKTSKPAAVACQLVAAWALGALVLPAIGESLLVMMFFGGFGPAVAVAVAGLAALLAYLIFVVAITREVTILGATAGRRLLWALAVLCGGSVGGALSWAAAEAAGIAVSRTPAVTTLLGGVPYALAAGLLLIHRWFRATALGLSVVLAGVGVAVLRHESPDELDARLAAADMRRETAYSVAVPGYRPTDGRDYGDGRGGGGFTPADPAAVPPDRYVTITTYDRVLPGERMCGQPNAQDSRLTWGSCTVEAGGLVYRHNEIEHGYQVPVGRRYVTVVGSPAVGHDVLRAAARTLRLATVKELGGHQEQTGDYYVATVPGYVGQVGGIPPSMIYAPADHLGSGGQSVAVTLYVTYASGDEVCLGATECRAEAGLTFVRSADTHGYVARHDDMNVRVMGGLRVDRALLRQAALDARPATDEELRRALPPLQPRNLVDHLRRWLRMF
ncbi:hypothetical protein ACIA5A_03315 [Micromonospora sp. NPDC051300]|uniref:hypothetical protein n=1 Tax=Micromonospora sp. NPDC051300 TaxID=3364286 RepID=UPI00379D0FE2